MKRRYRILLAVGAILVLSVAASALWLRSEAGLGWMLRQAERRSNGALHIGSHQGALGRPILLKDLEWDAGPLRVHVDSARLEWQSATALLGRAQLSSLAVDGVQVSIRAGAAGKSAKPLFPMVPPAMPHLPVRLVFEDVKIRDLSFSPDPSAPPIRLDRLDFAARVDNDAISVRQLQAEGPTVSARGSLLLAMNRDYALDATFDWDYTQPGWAPFHGHTELKGDDRDLAVHQTLAAPYSIVVDGALLDAFTAPTWRGRVQTARLAWARVHEGWPDYSTDVRLDFHGGLASTFLKGDVDASGLPAGPVRSKLDVAVRRAALDIRSLEAALAGGGRLSMQGTVDFDAEQHTRLNGSWQNLSWPVAEGRLSSPQGKFSLVGDKQQLSASLTGALAPQATVQAQVKVALRGNHAWSATATATDLANELVLQKPWMQALQPTGNWRLAAHGDMDTVQLDRLQGGWLGGGLTATGLYRRGVRQRWQLRAVLQQIRVARVLRDWRGRLDGVVTAHGDFGAGARPHTEVQLQSLAGTLRGSELTAQGHAVFDGADWDQVLLDAKLGDDTLHLDSDSAPGGKLRWQIDAPSLAQAWPDAEGSLHSQGTLDAGAHLSLLDLKLDLSRFAWHRYQADLLHVSAHAGRDSHGEAELHGENLIVPGMQARKLDLHASGAIARHDFLLDLDSDRGAVHLAGTGDYAAGRWLATLSKVAVTPTGDGLWQAATPWTLDVAGHHLQLPRACLAHDKARACASLSLVAQGWHVQGDVQALPLNSLRPLLPKGLQYTGALDGKLDAAGDGHGHTLNVDATLSPGEVRDLTQGKPLTLLAYSGGEAHMSSTPTLTVGHVEWDLASDGRLAVDTRMTFGASPSLTGSITGDIRDFALVPALIPEVSQASGQLALDIRLSGTPAEPAFDGTSTFSQGQVSIPRLGLNLSNLQFTLVGKGAHLDLAGSVHSGSGDLSFTAAGSREHGVLQAQGKLQGDDVRMLDVPEAKVDVTPDMTFALKNRDLRVDGTVIVPHALIQPKDLSAAAQVSPDQVIVGEQGGPPEERWHLYSRIKVVLGDDVHFDGFNLTGDVGGQVVANTVPGHPATGAGELTVRSGTYTVTPLALLGGIAQKFGSQKLAIEQGRLIFTGGPIANPALDMRAVKVNAHPEMVQFGGVEQKVGVQVRGLLQSPVVTLWSDPPLPQAQLLSYLVTGSAATFTGGTASSSTPGVVTASTLSGVSAQNNQEVSVPVYGGFDVSRSQVQTASGSYSSGVFVGKQVGERLYVRMGQVTGDPTSIFQVIYRLSTQWMLQAQSGSANSADIIYTIEH
ncbi:MAG TPA: translocation/assembly module TamB domain-containing protein [Gammaproteobacteria bacterium]|nr:translocation/assembly module TamB domain-containing protein [Gammaproteobacteria bacterium]